MIIAVVIALVIMMVFVGKISRFINKHPTLQPFLLDPDRVHVVGGRIHVEVPKGYIYLRCSSP